MKSINGTLAPQKQKGFTLIELVMVIVILGILSAFALPRFADLSGDAERASIDGARGSVKSALGIVRSAALAGGKSTANTTSASGDGVTLEGTEVELTNGFLAVESLGDAAQLGDYDVDINTPNAIISINGETGDPCFNFNGSTGTSDPADVSTRGVIQSNGTCS